MLAAGNLTCSWFSYVTILFYAYIILMLFGTSHLKNLIKKGPLTALSELAIARLSRCLHFDFKIKIIVKLGL